MGRKPSTSPRADGPHASLPRKAWTPRPEHARVPLLILSAYVLFAFFLPWLAQLTPPGVDMRFAQLDAERKELEAADKCKGACDALACPEGWTTALSAEVACKCICKRLEMKTKTKWDLEQEARKAELIRRTQEQMEGR
ncbi:hypothetical protein AB1Y20_010230 [Prymnesium parvum]|uniref:Uncharacterized protein n=1 Tax=Prymnesium parvum TaxID=97485 RepID=A0AB34K6L2_PRYPA